MPRAYLVGAGVSHEGELVRRSEEAPEGGVASEPGREAAPCYSAECTHLNTTVRFAGRPSGFTVAFGDRHERVTCLRVSSALYRCTRCPHHLHVSGVGEAPVRIDSLLDDLAPCCRHLSAHSTSTRRTTYRKRS